MRRSQKLFALVLGLSFGVLSASLPTAAARADDDDDRPRVAGTWVTRALVDAGPGAAPLLNLELTSFHPDGTLSTTSSVSNAHSSGNPFGPPPFAVDASDGYGTWERTGRDRIAFTFKRLLFAGARTPAALYGQLFNGQHVGVGTVQATGVVRRDDAGDVVEGQFTFQLRNLSGHVVFAGRGSFTTRRVIVEPLAAP